MDTLFEIGQSSKQELPLRCPHCATLLIIRHGTYPRAHPEISGQVAVQRYLCKAPDCPAKTFSDLPHPFLPILRHFPETLLRCHTLYHSGDVSQAAIARLLGVTREIIKRLSIFCRSFFPWLNKEKSFADWGPDPEANAAALWPDFIRDFSQKFYPNRWAPPPPT